MTNPPLGRISNERKGEGYGSEDLASPDFCDQVGLQSPSVFVPLWSVPEWPGV